MKLIIIDGPDRTGKNLQIERLIDIIEAKNPEAFIKVFHCAKPAGKTNAEKWEFQKKNFNELVHQIIENAKDNEFDYMIANRFIEGEYVYGQLYRKENAAEVKEFITKLQNKLVEALGEENILYVSLYARPEFLSKLDDGHSFSNGDVEKIKTEIKLFEEVFNFSVYKHKNRIETTCNGCWASEFRITKELLKDFEIVNG